MTFFMHHCQDCKFWIHDDHDLPLDPAQCIRFLKYGDTAAYVDGQMTTWKEFGCTQWEEKR